MAKNRKKSPNPAKIPRAQFWKWFYRVPHTSKPHVKKKNFEFISHRKKVRLTISALGGHLGFWAPEPKFDSGKSVTRLISKKYHYTNLKKLVSENSVGGARGVPVPLRLRRILTFIYCRFLNPRPGASYCKPMSNVLFKNAQTNYLNHEVIW